MNLMIDPRITWNVIYNARSNRNHNPTSPNTAPATQKESHDWSASHMKRHCNAWSNKSHTTTSAYTAHATQNESHDWSASHMKRHFQCAEQAKSPSNLTKYCAAPATKSSSSRLHWKLSELLPPIERRFEQIPSMIRPWNRHLAPAASETLLVPSWRRILYGKIQHFAFRLSPKMSPHAVPATKSHTPTSPNTAPATKSHTPTSPNTAPATKNAPYPSVGYSLRIFSLLASNLLASIPSRHLFSLGIYPLGISSL